MSPPHGNGQRARLTVLDLGHLATDFAEDFTPPPLALPQVLAVRGESRSPVGLLYESEFGCLRFSEAVQHRLRLFFVTSHCGWSAMGQSFVASRSPLRSTGGWSGVSDSLLTVSCLLWGACRLCGYASGRWTMSRESRVRRSRSKRAGRCKADGRRSSAETDPILLPQRAARM